MLARLKVLLVALALAPALSSSAWLSAVEDTPSTPNTQAPQTPATSVADLQAGLPQVASLAEQDGALLWKDGDTKFHVIAVDNGNARVETVAGNPLVARKLIADNRVDALPVLKKLVDSAKAENLKLDDFTFNEGILTGLHLRSAEVLVLAEGVVRKSPIDPVDRKEQLTKLAALTKQVSATLPNSSLDIMGRKTVDDILDRVAIGDESRKFDFDEVVPSFARRVVRSGWMDKLLKEQSLDKQVLAAVDEAEKFQPVTVFEGKNLRLAEVKNAFGNSGWVLTTPKRCVFTHQHAVPMYLFSDLKLNVVVELPPGSDAVAMNAQPIAAQLYQPAQSQLLASWTKEKGFVANEAEWRKALPAKGPRLDANIVENYLPPHIVVTSLNGDIKSVITDKGVLTPPKDAQDSEAERFLSEAAKMLPDAAHLDLVGEYLFYYVYDSPDTRFPLLIGNKTVRGDIHQTALQTLDTVAGGMFRGDCDDLSELYQTIAERQNRTAHVITLPAHAALAFAENHGQVDPKNLKADGDWHVFILQTGQPYEFADAKLPEALKKAYSKFNEADTFDPNGLGLLLRFSGENTRSGWRLSWRIFAEPEYAKTMIDVQKDWHFQTYQRGIAKMLKLIADGDNDTANFRELSGLYSFTGQYDLAVEYHQKALDRTDDPESKLYSSLELVMHLFDAKNDAKAKELALDIMDTQLPLMRQQLGPRAAQLGMELANTLSKGKAYDLATRALKDTVLDEMTQQIEQVGQWLGSAQFNQRRWESADQLRHMQAEFVGCCMEILDGLGQKALPGDDIMQTLTKDTQDWLNKIAFFDVDEPEDVMLRYATAGQFYAAILGESRLLAALQETKLPTSAEFEHTKRIGGFAQFTIDLPWIKLSVPFWGIELSKKFERDAETLDKDLVAKIGKQLQESYDACAKLGIEHNTIEHMHHIGTLIVALVQQDEKVLHERLKYVKEKNDKRLRDDTAQWIGDTARFLPLDWYGKVLQIWKEELNYKPKYFWIAWRAALNKAPQHALMVAKMAATEFKDDPAFTEEYDFMRKLLEKPEAKDRPETPVPAPKVVAPKE